MNLTPEQAAYLFSEEQLSMSLIEVREKINACRIEIKKYRRPSGIWVVYHKELIKLHALAKYKKAISQAPAT